MHIPAKVDYGVRAMLALAAADGPQTAEDLAAQQELPARFLGAIMTDLRRAGLVASQRGIAGGFRLAKSPASITVGDIIRVLDGPLAEIRGARPDQTVYSGAAASLQTVWVAARASLRSVLDGVTLDDIIHGSLPPQIMALTADQGAWDPR